MWRLVKGVTACFLARKGWDVTGYDISSVGLNAARKSAEQAGLKILTVLKEHRDFDFGVEQWDLIVMVFPGMSMGEGDVLGRIKALLKDGGIIVVEQFNAPPGLGAKGHRTRYSEPFRIIVVRYEDVEDTSDWDG